MSMIRITPFAESQLYGNFFQGHDQIGHGIPVFIGNQYQKGYGLGNVLGGLFKGLIPIVKSGVKGVLKTAGRELAKGGLNVASNVLMGQNVKTAMKQEASKRLKSLKRKANVYAQDQIARLKEQPMQKRKKRLSTVSRNRVIKKNRRKDIFN